MHALNKSGHRHRGAVFKLRAAFLRRGKAPPHTTHPSDRLRGAALVKAGQTLLHTVSRRLCRNPAAQGRDFAQVCMRLGRSLGPCG